MVADEDHGAVLDRDCDPLRDRLRAVLPRLHVLPALSDHVDHWTEWLVRTRFAHLSDAERDDLLARLGDVRDRVLDRARIRPGETVADVGAGTGLLTLGAAVRVGHDGEVVAIDVSADALEELRRVSQHPNITYRIGDATVLPLMDASVDVVATRSVLIYVREKQQAAREFFRVLRTGGRLSVFEPINRRATRVWDVVDFGELRERVIDDFQREWPSDDPIHDFEAEDLVHFFERAGFDDVELEVDEIEQEVRPDQMLSAVGAPGHGSLAERWRDAFAPSEAEALEQAVENAGSLTLRLPVAFVSGEKP